MNDNTHPSLDSLKQYALQPEAENFAPVALHLAACVSCRQQLDALVKLSDADVELENPCDESLQADIQDYMDGRLLDTQAIEDRLQHDKAAIKAALHYACADSAMGRNQNRPTDESTRSDKPAFFQLSRLFQFRAPLWLAFPAGALASLLLAWFLVPMMQELEPYKLVAYQDNPNIEFQSGNTMPGMGFFRSAKKQSQIFKQPDIQLIDNKQIRIQWPPVDNALSYTIRLYTFEKGEKRSLGKVSTDKLFAVFDTHSIALKRRYEWVLSGTTRDHKQFNVAGGFVIH